MSEEQLKAFLAKVKGDSSLQEKLKAAKSSEDVVGIAKEYGHEFTADKITELSKDEWKVWLGDFLLALEHLLILAGIMSIASPGSS